MQALFDKLKSSHLDLKDEVKELCRRCSTTVDLTTFKSLLLQFPPLHSLNDILEDMTTTPNMKMTRNSTSPRTGMTPKVTPDLKRRSDSSVGVPAAKSLKFSPHLLKIEPTTSDVKEYSPNGVLEVIAAVKNYKGDEDDDIIEIDGM